MAIKPCKLNPNLVEVHISGEQLLQAVGDYVADRMKLVESGRVMDKVSIEVISSRDGKTVSCIFRGWKVLS